MPSLGFDKQSQENEHTNIFDLKQTAFEQYIIAIAKSTCFL
jgi:hypothetical protein